MHNTARTVSRRAQNVSHSVVKHTQNFVNNHRRAIEITRNVVAIASIAVLFIPAAPAMAIVAPGIVEFGLDLAVGDNTSAAVGLLCLFPMGKGFKYVTEIGGDAIKGGSKVKNLYKAEGLLEMDLQKFGKLVNKTEREMPWILPNSLPREEEKAVLNTLKCIDSGTKPSSSLVKKWGTKFGNYQGELPNGKYREFRVSPPAGTKNAGVRRIVGNIETGELYYTWTHYGDTGKPVFVKIG